VETVPSFQPNNQKQSFLQFHINLLTFGKLYISKQLQISLTYLIKFFLMAIRTTTTTTILLNQRPRSSSGVSAGYHKKKPLNLSISINITTQNQSMSSPGSYLNAGWRTLRERSDERAEMKASQEEQAVQSRWRTNQIKGRYDSRRGAADIRRNR
jgi:hypothetical protein